VKNKKDLLFYYKKRVVHTVLERELGSNFITLSSKVIIRKENFGGILFNKETGDIIEVDREAFIIISILKDIEIVDTKAFLELPISCKGKKISRTSIEEMISRLFRAGVIDILPKGVLSEDRYGLLEEFSCKKIEWPMFTHLSAPETVHWAVTFRCGEACPDCYMERHKKLFTNELDTRNALKLIDKIASAGVFQLAIGGGEPFLRDDLEIIAGYAMEKGLAVHITTGRYEIEDHRLDELAEHIKVLQIGIRTAELLHINTGTHEELRMLVAQLNQRRITTGANLIMTRSAIRNLDRIIGVLSEVGFRRYTLLRYKPPINVKRWLKEKPDKYDIEILEEKLTRIGGINTDIYIRIDCSFSFLGRKLNPQIAAYSGIKGCVAADRIMSLAPDGSVFPCSQLTGAAFNAGNLIDKDFESIWNGSEIIRKYRGFRTKKSFKHGDCGKCKVKNFCGGCRVFASDALSSDPGCPVPLYDTGYIDDEVDIISGIQDVIGCTSAGFPYARREEIETWLEEEDDRGYPSWINLI
jgi:radical SAM protein with 4Fe4S-binding SPASM domain